MPKNPDLKSVLVIGSGPIVIGQAAEFDYAGTQACRALREEGIEIILVNSNPATIMTDTVMADHIYIEPLNLDVLRRVIIKHKPDGLLSTLGGQTGLTLSMQLAREGFLDKHNVRLLGARVETIDRAEDRQLFKDAMTQIGQPCIPSRVVTAIDDALSFAREIGYPVIVRPAFTLGGSGGGIAADESELRDIAAGGLRASPIRQILIERCVSGWKEIEFEVMRDSAGNAIIVCSMENVDPVGVHTGDSIVVAPCLTLADREYQMLANAAIDIVSFLGVEGGCNVQFALHPHKFTYAVIEVNPRVSRSSALASKATGYPIAKIATKVALGYRLDELKNAITGTTPACQSPAIDYVVVKFPRWPFDKFVYAKRTLGTQMKATGEVMAIGASVEEALMKAVRSVELKLDTLALPKLRDLSAGELRLRLHDCDDERIFVVAEALRRGIGIDEINAVTKIDPYFLARINNIVEIEKELEKKAPDAELLKRARRAGFSIRAIERLGGECGASYRMVDTCAAEYEALTPYFYSVSDGASEAEAFVERSGDKKKVVVLGSGPIRIGQGIEFDYCSVHCAWALRKLGYETSIINCNPETVSTDFDTADRLYFEPLTLEDVMNVLKVEKPVGVVVQFGGQTAIKLAEPLASRGVKLLGTQADAIDAAENRERFDALLEKCGIARPEGRTVLNAEQALKAARELGYPVLLRPSYVLGGQNMIIAHGDDDVTEYMAVILAQGIDSPVLIDKYLKGTELEVDAVYDGESILIPGIMEHIERAGIHSGDSISVYPPLSLDEDITRRIIEYTEQLAREIGVIGLVNIQYILVDGRLYVIEVNPRSSRTIPYISKVTGVPLVDLATRVMCGVKLADCGCGTGLYKTSELTAVKVPVFSFEKLHDVDTHLGPEMKSTGEALGIAYSFEEALLKGLIGAGMHLRTRGGVLLSVRDSDKEELCGIARGFSELGFALYATVGTAEYLEQNGLAVKKIGKIGEGEENPLTLMENGHVDYVISTSKAGRKPARDSVRIRRRAAERGIPCLTSLDTARAISRVLSMNRPHDELELIDICEIGK